MASDRFAVFEVSGETALAWYFVMAHWPAPDSQPVVDFSSGAMSLLLRDRKEVFADLRTTLARALPAGGRLHESAVILQDELDHRGGADLSPASN
jgi:hypothetical protein